VLVVVEQALGDVERGDVVVLGPFGEGEYEFVAGAALGVDA
jgi:GTPase